jgi:hypothetical protein
MNQNEKVDRYLQLFANRNRLVDSSQGIIRKRKSPLARKISNGDVKAIIQAAKDRVYGSISIEKRKKLCELLCELKRKLSNKSPGEAIREIIAWAVTGILGLIDAASGLTISLLWVLREKLESIICPCSLDSACLKFPCLSIS